MAKSKWLRQQKPSRRVVLALLPCVAGGVYFFGWRSLAMVVAACAAGYLFEWIFCRTRKEAVSEAVFVTGTLFALIMPPTVSWPATPSRMRSASIFSRPVKRLSRSVGPKRLATAIRSSDTSLY